jgi:translation initiation factor IF-3
LQFRGRENAHREIGMDLMNKVIEDVKGTGIVDAPPRLQGRSIGMQLAPDTHK